MSHTTFPAPIVMAPLQSYTTRNGSSLTYRHYPASSSPFVIVLYHGSITHSGHVAPLAVALSAANTAEVYTPDIRGHGIAPAHRGDMDYVGQADDDITDFLRYIRPHHPHQQIIIAGHSMGGGLIIKYAACTQEHLDGCIALAPYLGPKAPINRKVTAPTWKLTALEVLNQLGITWFNGSTAAVLNVRDHLKDGTQTGSYTYRLLASCVMIDHGYDWYIEHLHTPLLLLAGSDDALFAAQEYAPLFVHDKTATVRVLPHEDHDTIIACHQTVHDITQWLATLPPRQN